MNNETETTAWITKYALTKGIFKVTGRISEQTDTMFYWRLPGKFEEYAHGNEWHTTPEAALAEAENMRIKKLRALDKQIQKISTLKFVAES